MSTSNSFRIWFLDRVRATSDRFRGEGTALFFLGLSAPQAKLLSECELASSSLVELLDEQGHINYSMLETTKRDTFISLVSSNEPQALLYEQLGSIKGSLEELYDGRIVIVRNNLFLDSEGYPCPGSNSELSALTKYLDGDGGKAPASAQCYGQVSSVGEYYLVSPIRFEDELDCEVIDLVESVDDIYSGEAIANPISVPGPQYLSARLATSHGLIADMSFNLGDMTVAELGSDGKTLLQLAGVLLDCGADCSVIKTAPQTKEENEGTRLLPLLKKYWGKDATFRKLRFYKNPDKDNEMIEVSQGAISDYVVSQAELALEGSEDFTSTLMTAPTGAGKSLLFQLAALYLADKHNIVTIVVEPLKALMKDQAENLRSRGIRSVAAINSDISFDERNKELARIREGKVSIIYLSPELLLSSSIDDVLCGRKLGLVVVDEVHTVTSWGKDFRPDYWYLGTYLAKLRRRGMLFPMFCLTATAVYGGKDDVVNQTISDLELGSCKLFLGNPRREDISFSIQKRNRSDFDGRIDEVKFELAAKWINESVASDKKAIVYCPYTTHVDQIMSLVGSSDGKVLGFHGKKDKEFREFVTSAFKSGSCRVLVSTKAFGMGIDIGDITAIYHFAPTGNLADYVQEIGRAARKKSVQGVASIDFFSSDSSYARRLYAMSGFAQWQLKEIMGKLYSIYVSKPRGKRSQNILVSPDSFSYLFANNKNEDKPNRVKAALMMIAQDLKSTYNFPVIVVRPKPTYTTAYVCISSESEGQFLSEFGNYVKKVSEAHTRYEAAPNQNTVKITDTGSIYLLQADKMWEERFSDRTFAQFKHDLFSGDIASFNGTPSVSSRLILEINYEDDFAVIENRFTAYMDALKNTLIGLSRRGEFSKSEFKSLFEEKLSSAAPAIKNTDALLTLFVKPSGAKKEEAGGFKFIFRKTAPSSGVGASKHSYQVSSKDVLECRQNAMRALRFLNPGKSRRCVRYLDPKALGGRYHLAELLQTLELATYEARGGDNPEIFIRLNDPTKLKALSTDPEYSNSVLKEQRGRHDYSSRVITRFFMTPMSTDDRWDLIEEYFLGNDDFVAARLGLDAATHNVLNDETTRKVKYRGKSRIFTGLHATVINDGMGFPPQPYFRIWRSLAERASSPEEQADLERLKEATKGARYEYPSLKPELRIESTGDILHPLLAWKERQVLLFRQKSAAEYDLAKKTDWVPYLLGQGDSIVKLVDDIVIKRRREVGE